MSDKHDHHRDNEGVEYGHQREEDISIPASIKWIATFINRVGFPIFAFCVLTYFCFVKMDENTKIIGQLRDVMMSVKITLDNRGR